MIIIGTAGHIDHGKTSLVGALTGIQTDRLKEEQERGISIELGFAYFDLPGEVRCGIVDVPGHERFVRQMIAGATGIDLVVLVVAADEGVMQQTREHVDICNMLGIRAGLVVLTKVDLVDEEWLELVESDLEDYLVGTFLEGAPMLRFAAPDPATHDPVRDALAAMVADIDRVHAGRDPAQPLRMPIDRVFTMRGFGTVVTGTVASGALASGEAVTLLPGGLRTKVRGVQSHGEPVNRVVVGQRAAINLQGVEKESVSRGNVLCHADALEATRMLDVDLHVLSHMPRPLETQAKVLVHVGTSQVNGTVVLLDREQVEPGETGPAQLRLDDFVVVLGGDHFVIRGFDLLESYGKTLGGGTILHPVPRRHRSHRRPVLDGLAALRTRKPRQVAEATVLAAGHTGATDAQIRQVMNASTALTAETLDALLADGVLHAYVHGGRRTCVHRDLFAELLQRARETIAEYHARYPHRGGVPREELRSQVRGDMPPPYFAELLATLAATGEAEASGSVVRRVGFERSLSAGLQALRERILTRYQGADYQPPLLAELLEELTGAREDDVREMLNLLVEEGALAKAAETLYFGASHIERLKDDVRAFLRTHGEMTTPQLKDLTGASRKFTVPLGEYLDAAGVTRRRGDIRILREAPA